MKKEQKQQYKELISAYESLSEKEKAEARKKIDRSWYDICDKYINLCEQDQTLVSAYDELENAEQALRFDMTEDTHFRRVKEVYNEFDHENRVVLYEFDQEKFNKAKYDSENWEAVKAELEIKIEKLEKQKFSLFRNSKIRKAKAELETRKRLVKEYEYAVEKQNLKDYYVKKQAQLDQLRETYNELLAGYAKQVVAEGIKEYPNLICYSHSSFTSTAYKRNFAIEAMKKALDDVRFEALLEEAEDEPEME